MSKPVSTIKRILVPLDLSAFTDAATERACRLAKANDATVTGMTVLDTPAITGQTLPVQPFQLLDYTQERIESRTEEAQMAVQDALRRFASVCEDAVVSHDQAEYQGIPADQIVEASHFYDLLVMGLRTFFHFETQTGPGDSLERVLDHTPTPVLALPKTVKPLCSVLIAFDGSFHSVRALHAFAGIHWPEQVQITLLTSDDSETHRAHLLNEAAAYLRSYGFEDIRKEGISKDISKAVDEDYVEKCDLIVAGMHAKKRLRDFFVGSLTKQLIEYGHTALLLA